ncbi:MAG: metallopeptidase TldD-related protein [Candidatus Asgardarchaeia archaeon]
MEDELQKIVEYGIKLGADFVDLRLQSLETTKITLNNRKIEVSSSGIEQGVGIRVFVNGAMGFATSSTLDEQTIFDAVKTAYKMAKISSEYVKIKVPLAEVKIVNDTVKANVKVDPRDVSSEEKISNLVKTNTLILNSSEYIRNSIFEYADIALTQLYVSSEGAYVDQEKIYVWGKVVATARKNDVFASSRYEFGSTFGFDIWNIETPEKICETISNRLIKQLDAKVPKAGRFPVVLAPEVVGVFTHEAFGHLAEADLALTGAVTLNKLGQQVASPLVSIYDDGTLENGFGSFKYDDEGVPAQKTLLVDKGKIVSLLYDRHFSSLAKVIIERMGLSLDNFNTSPTGNARAESFRFPPIIRMRNTYIAPGDLSVEELFEGIKFGYYLVSFRGGQANLDGTFQVGIQEGYEIVNGEIGSPIRNLSISGNTLETLLAVDGVGKDMGFETGRCGKGQTAFVGSGGPHIRVRELVIGGQRK